MSTTKQTTGHSRMDPATLERMNRPLREVDPEIAEILELEARRQATGLELIPSENLVSEAVLEAVGSVLTNKYAEGYPGKRYYGGCEFVDRAEQLAIDRAKQLFGAEHANVQAHSGTQANISVYMAALQPGDTVLGHESGARRPPDARPSAEFFGQDVQVHRLRRAQRHRNDRLRRNRAPGRGAQTEDDRRGRQRLFAHHRFRAHGAHRRIGGRGPLRGHGAHRGLVAAGVHPSPVPHADFVSTTTHKTLRGPRGGLVLCRQKWAKELDRITFPGTQGGPLMHTIAAKAVCLKEAMQPEFREYQKQVVANAKALAAGMARRGFRIVSGGTDNHLFLVDLYSRGLTGKDAQASLDRATITVNKNAIPFDPTPPMTAGGIRLGSPAVTTRGMREPEMERIAGWICDVLAHVGDAGTEQRVRARSGGAARRNFPLYMRRWHASGDRLACCQLAQS